MKIGPKYKICRRLGDSVFDKCQTPKFQVSRSKKMVVRPRRRKPRTQYGLQLIEKQKTRFGYYINEKQMRNYVRTAGATQGKVPVVVLYELLESRLDNVVYRVGLVKTRPFARQVVNHGHICVNGRKVTIPSYSVKVGDVVSVRPQSRDNKLFADRETLPIGEHPKWIDFNEKKLEAKITVLPVYEERDDLSVDLGTVIEFYSRV